ncbi:rolling circle replication-associated protein, partial [Clostridium perfringens]
LEKTGVAVWHYHLLLYNVIEKVDVKRLSEIWGNGFIKINSIKDVDNVGAYVCKYMTKQHKDRLQGKKMYFNSRNLKKPVEIKEEHALKEFAKTLKHAHLKYTNTFLNEYNSVQYSQYIISENDIASNNMDILEFTDCLQEHNKNLVSV